MNYTSWLRDLEEIEWFWEPAMTRPDLGASACLLLLDGLS